MTDFEKKLIEILNDSASGKLEAVEFAVSNGDSDKDGKVIQTVSFSYEIDEGTKPSTFESLDGLFG